MLPLMMFSRELRKSQFNMSDKRIKVEMDKNSCSYVVLSLVSIKVILRLLTGSDS